MRGPFGQSRSHAILQPRTHVHTNPAAQQSLPRTLARDPLYAHSAEPRPCRKRTGSIQRGQKVQKVQQQCRDDFQKCTASQSWTSSRSALTSAESAESASIFKKLFRRRKYSVQLT